MNCGNCKYWMPREFSKKEQIMTIDAYYLRPKKEREAILDEIDRLFCSIDSCEREKI